MRLRDFFLIALLINISLPLTYSQEFTISDEPELTGMLFTIDQTFPVNAIGIENFVFSLSGRQVARQSFSSRSVAIMDMLNPNIIDGQIYLKRVDGGFRITYTTELSPPIDPNDRLTEGIKRIGDIVHFPDRNNHSHRLTLDGEYLGKFPNYIEHFGEFLFQNGVTRKGEPLNFPLHIFGQIFTDFHLFKDVLLLINRLNVFATTKQNLIEDGEEAQYHSVRRTGNIRFISRDFPIFKMGERIYTISSTPKITATTITSPRDGITSFSNNFFYVTKTERRIVKLLKYRITGLQLTPSSIGNQWELYE